MNPLMGGRMGNLMQVMSQVSRLRQNPNGIADLLKQQGRINDDQYAAIQKMNDPAQIGQYLIQSGVMPQQQTMQAAQTIVPQIQQQMK
jgi:hypothetical protein